MLKSPSIPLPLLPLTPLASNVLCIAGPTAAGKTAAALCVAQALSGTLPVEIISVDSALVYQGMDIGTAKPSKEERAAAPHHLIDIIDPAQSYSAAQFVSDTQRLIKDIRARGAWPLLAGGTMLYFKALFEGLDPMPAANAQIRADIDRQAIEQGWPAVHAELARVDPATASRLAPGDTQRIQRALEVFRSSGIPLSAWHKPKEKLPLPPMISLEPNNRAWLHERIQLRFEQMLHNGLMDEVQRLRSRGDLHLGLPSMRCVGYRQAWEWLDRASQDSQPHGLAALAELGSAATRQLAKRQLTWLRSMPHRHVVVCDESQAQEKAVALAKQLIEQALKS